MQWLSCGLIWRAVRNQCFNSSRTLGYLAMSNKNLSPDSRQSERLKQIHQILDGLAIKRKLSSSGGGEWLSIGEVKAPVLIPTNPELTPRLYAESSLSQVSLRHLKWMLQKDALGQDMFLLGSPGPYRRQLAMAFCELTGREVEYVSLSRDTTETDLKQRREIINSTVHYMDQCAVEACLKGRVLVLDGIEKAERNVLPVLNNLLENREMQLDDGRLIVDHQRYDRLKEEHGESTLSSWNIARAHEKFRVIALGLPVPPYKGNPLDPPLRSRFQARTIFQVPFQDQLDQLRKLCPGVDDQMLSSVLSVTFALNSLSHSQLSGGPVDLAHHLPHISATMNGISGVSVSKLLQSIYPSQLLGTDGLFKDALQKFGLPDDRQNDLSVVAVQPSGEHSLLVTWSHNSKKIFNKPPTSALQVSGWPQQGCWGQDSDSTGSEFVATRDHQQLLSDMLMSHHGADFCLVGAKGTGKTSLVSRFASLLGYEVEPISLYQDMTSRDLLQQRTTLSNGDTAWRETPLITAARLGRLAVLDGIHRVDTGTLTVLKSFIHDRSLHLMDGTRLLSQQSYDAAKSTAKITDKEMAQRKIFSVHPKFRMIGIGETVKSSGSSQPSGHGSSGHAPSLAPWISPEVMSMFQFHHVKALPVDQEKLVIQHKVPEFSGQDCDTMLQFVHSLRSSQDPTLQSLSSSVSTRQLLRIAKRLSSHPTESLYQATNKACLSRFLPQLTRGALQQALRVAGIQPPSVDQLEKTHTSPLECKVKDGVLHIGSTSYPVSDSRQAAAMVPDVLFYDNQLHLRIMEDMLRDFMLGEHLLLVGNQGVGKNKIVDRFLHLLNLPREYLQLHRDSTVQTLTLQPSVRSGRVVYQDSPLVRALVSGMVLVVDEADKAPTHVTCILKNIVEGSEITLADGRRIVHSGEGRTCGGVDSLLVHPNFRMIVLANRPGFPFLGNDFFASLGDIFSCHAVDNPDLESEKAMLQQYGSSVSDAILTKIVLAFSELRQMADDGLIAYPYSTREVVNIVKHLQAYPSDGLGGVVRNVFDFDSFNEELLQVVLKVLHKHGVPAGASKTNIQLAPQYPLSKPTLVGKWRTRASQSESLSTNRVSVNLKGPYKFKSLSVPVDRIDSRGRGFSEMKCYCSLPLHETNRVVGVCSNWGNDGQQYLQVLTDSPLLLYSLPLQGTEVTCLSLDDMFPALGAMGHWKPSAKIAGLSGDHQDKCLIHEQQTDTLLLVQPLENRVWNVKTDSLAKSMRDILRFRQQSSKNIFHRLAQGQNNLVIVWKEGSSEVTVLDFSGASPSGRTIDLPLPASRVMSVSNDQCIVSTDQNRYFVIDGIRNVPTWKEVVVEGTISPANILKVGETDLSEKSCKGSEFLTPDTRVLAGADNSAMATVVKHLPLDDVGAAIYSLSNEDTLDSGTALACDSSSSPVLLPQVGGVCYPATFQTKVDQVQTSHESGLVLVDLPHSTWRKIVLPMASAASSFSRHRHSLHLAGLDHSTVAAVDIFGTVRILEVGLTSILSSMEEWQKLVGDDENKQLQITHSRDSGLDVSSPKHGKVDEKNAPHVGGNTWAGGTGGRDTAGLGGKGGPYRLDAGHDVYQLSDEEKNSVPEDVRQKSREMGQKARQERLREIEMSEHDADMYGKIVGKVKNQIQALRVMLSSIEAKNKERQWIRNQTSGDLDERKLIDGLTGEKSVYKRRGEKEPDFNTEHVYPTRVRVVVDVSGSMYRFNSYDGRLDRTIEAALMVMEACQNVSNIKIDIVGHSGDSDEIPFVNSSSPPSNDKERLQILKTMIAESQFCWSGDHTIEATRTAIEKISSVKAEQRYVVVLSDANFSRYGIKPTDFSKLMFDNEAVKVYAIFIGSLGDQAARLKNSLPAGTSYICMDNRDLPNILKSILSSIHN